MMNSVAWLKPSRSIGAMVLLLTGLAGAQAAPPAPPPVPPAVVPPPTPQQTTATFADWTVHCSHAVATTQSCEIVQVVASQGRAVAQIALGRLARNEPLHLTLLVPPSVTLAQPPRLTGAPGSGKGVAMTELAWRRCLPGGCLAEATLSDELLRQLKARSDALKILFLDGAGQEATVPLSPQGLAPALEALAREDGV